MDAIQPEFQKYRDALSRELRSRLTLAKEMKHVDMVKVEGSEQWDDTYYVKTIGDIVPQKVRQQVNLGRLEIREIKSMRKNGSCKTYAKFEVTE